jgi:hypothetical protein
MNGCLNWCAKSRQSTSRWHGRSHELGLGPRSFLCLILGKRLGFGKDKMAPHSMCLHGWHRHAVGWLVWLQRGSALAADGIAAGAFMTTTLARNWRFVWASSSGFTKATLPSSASARASLQVWS